MAIMRVLVILTKSLNISINKEINPKMDSFIHLLLEIRVQIHKNFQNFSLNPSDIIKMENANNLIEYIMIDAKEIKESSISLINKKIYKLRN